MGLFFRFYPSPLIVVVVVKCFSVLEKRVTETIRQMRNGGINMDEVQEKLFLELRQTKVEILDSLKNKRKERMANIDFKRRTC